MVRGKKGVKPPDMTTLDMQTPERRSEIARMGGKTVTAKQRMAQKVRWLKEKGYTTKNDREWFLQRILDPETDIIYMQELNDRLLKALPEDKIGGAITNAIALHKAKFGEKHKNLNINVTLTDEDIRKRGEDLDKEIIEIMNSK